MLESFAHPVVSIIVEDHSGRGHVLLQRRIKELEPLRGLLELPQGRIREGESLVNCATRELKEETGLEHISWRRKIETSSIHSESLETVEAIAVVETGNHSYLAICVVCSAKGVPRASEESSDPRWYSREQVLKFIASGAMFPLNVPMLLAYYGVDTHDVPTATS